MEGFINTGPQGASPRVMVVCDESDTASAWAHSLRQKRLEVTLASTAAEAMDHWARDIPDLVVIDVAGAQLDGIALARQLRGESVAPILLFTPRHNESHILEAYQAGVDECVPKPVSPALFLAKVRAWLRRAWSVPAEVLETVHAGRLALDPARRQVTKPSGESVRLTNLEFRVLHLLMSHPGWVLPGDEIVQRVWGFYGEGDSTVLKNVIYRLRRKLEARPDRPVYIHTEAGVGYRFGAESNHAG